MKITIVAGVLLLVIGVAGLAGFFFYGYPAHSWARRLGHLFGYGHRSLLDPMLLAAVYGGIIFVGLLLIWRGSRPMIAVSQKAVA